MKALENTEDKRRQREGKGTPIPACVSAVKAASMELEGHGGAGGMGKGISRLLSEGAVVLRVFS